MNQPNFGSILDRPSNEVERPKPVPQGTYACVVKGQPRYDKSSKKQTEFVEFTLQPISAGEDVDQEALDAWSKKASGETRNLSDTTFRATYYITEDSVWRLKKFLQDLGIEEDEDGETKSLRQMIEEAPGRQVNAFMKHRASEDGQSVFAELANTAPAE